MRRLLQLTCIALLLPLLNGCAALAVSLAGAGAGAGFSHQLSGTATRTFCEEFETVDAATKIAARKMFLDVSEVSSIPQGQVTRARVSELDISIEAETLSQSLTRVSVIARKDFLRVDSATAQEIVAQIESALQGIKEEEANRIAQAEASEQIRKAALAAQRSTTKAKTRKSRLKKPSEI